jgi:DNA polymerase III delta prime subunit
MTTTLSPTDRLVEAALGDRLHHALILHGPSPSTLRSAAMRISKALNCPNDRGDDDCESCARIERGVHPDVQVLGPLNDRKAISIEQIRGLINNAGLRPYEAGVKVFIIDPADTMSDAAANSLLKTLEEPTSDTAFMLLTSSADLLLPTIRSRCQIIFVRPEEREDEADHSEVVEEILDRLERFASSRDLGALLGIGPVALSIEDVRQGMMLLATVLRDVAAGKADERRAQAIGGAIDTSALLEAAQTCVAGIDRHVRVNADPRLLIDQALAIIAAGRRA